MAGRRSIGPRGWAGLLPYPHLELVGIVTTSATDQQVDPLALSRAVRRALAAAGTKAVEVEVLVASERVVAGDEVRAFARRALGPHGDAVAVRSVPDREVMVTAVSIEPHALVVAVVGTDDETLVLCLRPPAHA